MEKELEYTVNLLLSALLLPLGLVDQSGIMELFLK